MENKHRYILASNKVQKPSCPKCNAKKHWQRYIDIQTGQVLPIEYGRCDNSQKCGHELNPYKEGYAKEVQLNENKKSVNLVNLVNAKNKLNISNTISENTPQPKTHIPSSVLKQSLQADRYSQNTFIQNLINRSDYPFKTQDIEKIISLYYLGTISKGYRKGAVTLPFIDIDNNIHTIQVKQFDQNNHTTKTDFLHSIINKELTKIGREIPDWLKKYINQNKFVSCLFGEHLLKRYPNNPIALVEAPKTAIYCALYFGFPDESINNYIWLAVYNKSSFTFDKLKVLKGNYISTFPDLSVNGNTFLEWKKKASIIESQLPGTKFIFSDFLEKYAPEYDRCNGYDIADYLIKLDWKSFRKSLQREPPQPNIQPVKKETIENITTSNFIKNSEKLAELCKSNNNITLLIQALDLEVCN